MTLPNLVGLIGRKRSGKDSVALEMRRLGRYHRVAFADALKEVALALDPTISSSFVNYEPRRLSFYVDSFGWEAAKEHNEVRRTLQRLGVAVREHVSPTAWVDVVAGKADELRLQGERVVVTDVRFPNEAKAIRHDGGVLLRVTRPGLPQDDLHISETALDNYPHDVLIENDGTLEDLHRKVRTTLDFLALPSQHVLV